MLALAGIVLLPLCGLAAEWQRDTTVNGVAFDKVKVAPDGAVIGYLAQAAIVRDRPCAREWIHLHPNGELARFTLSQELALPRVRIPAGTWVTQNANAVVIGCAFPADIEVQGHPCRGTGGSKGVHVAFYESGALKSFYPFRETRIDGILCATGLVRGGVQLHENGRLKSGRLAEELKRGERTYRKGTRIEVDPEGNVLPGS